MLSPRALTGVFAASAAAALLFGFQTGQSAADQLAQARNLGKAFYENPTTQAEAVEQFKRALDLAPDSARERINYGIALLRAAKTAEGIEELRKAQKQDPKIPHTWFNLGVAYQKDSKYEEAITQFEGMIALVPDEPISHYHLGYLYRLTGKPEQAVKEFETSSKLNPNLAGPHFALYNAWRQSRPEDAARENTVFQEIRKRNAGAAVPEDLDWSFYAEIYDPVNAPAVSAAKPVEVTFKTAKIADKLGDTGGLAAADIDGDGKADLIAWSTNTVTAFQSGKKPLNLGITDATGVVSVVPGDFNNDGVADLAILTTSGASLWANAKGKLTKSPVVLPAGKYSAAVWVDFDHDYDLDLFLLGDKSVLMRNNGTAGFSDESKSFPFVAARALSGVMFDLTPDTDGMDLAVSYADHAAVLYRDKLNGRYEAQDIPAIPAGVASLRAVDLNNDRATDLIASTASAVFVAWNRSGAFVKSDELQAPNGAAAVADFENRGTFDLATAGSIHREDAQGKFTARAFESTAQPFAMLHADFGLAALDATGISLTNTQAPGSAALQVSLAGVKNVKLAYGAKVEMKAGAHYQKQMYRGLPLSFGLPTAYKEADTVRITWPNGLIQNEVHQAPGPHAYKESQRLSGSCPMIFTWTGTEFRFLTDVLGVAPLGASSGDGHYFPTDHDEYVQIPGELMVPKDSAYEIRISEELREVSYLDQIRLMAVDHPADLAIYTNDKFKSPPFPDFRLYGVSKPLHPVQAHDDAGNDVLAKLLKTDRQYPDNYERDFGGTAKLHHLDLDFGKAAPSNRAVLILSGWVDWADGSTFLQNAQQSKAGLVMPYLQVKDAQGKWRTAIEDMGIPAGKPKTISVDLTGKFLSASREVRIVTNLCVYWDEIFLSEDTAKPDVVVSSIGADVADLHFRGFSKPVIDPERKQPENFLYTPASPVSQWNPTPGLYTRFGDVRTLLASLDDMAVIMGSGDELTLRFDPRRLPALKAGWKRDFLLFVDGWAKDADANTAFSTTVAPLPFHAMSAYPYGKNERYPTDAAHREFQKKYNTRPALRLLRPLDEHRRTT